MKILLTGMAMDNFSGQPLYVYELARELAKNHEVTVVSKWADNELKSGLLDRGVKCLSYVTGDFDLILASEWKPSQVRGKTFNIIHSEYEVESPLPGCDHYIAIRPSIKEHLIQEHFIPAEAISVIYNGVDRERFKPQVKTARTHQKVVVPCTRDFLREPFLQHLAQEASETRQLYLYGEDFGARLPSSPYIHLFPSKFHIEEEIAQADEVAGILLGRVNLEANACGVPSYIYDPITLEKELFYLEEETFDQRHNITNVSQQILNLC